MIREPRDVVIEILEAIERLPDGEKKFKYIYLFTTPDGFDSKKKAALTHLCKIIADLFGVDVGYIVLDMVVVIGCERPEPIWEIQRIFRENRRLLLPFSWNEDVKLGDYTCYVACRYGDEIFIMDRDTRKILFLDPSITEEEKKKITRNLGYDPFLDEEARKLLKLKQEEQQELSSGLQGV